MKKRKGLLVSYLLVVVIITINLLFCFSCRQHGTLSRLGKYKIDEEWIQSLNKFLSLSYVENENIAAFVNIPSKGLIPSLYTTCAVTNILKNSNKDISDKNQIVQFVESLRNSDGAYVDNISTTHMNPPNETLQAIVALANLGIDPEEKENITKYLFSLQIEDGTFLMDAREGITERENTVLRRISIGTNAVINSLLYLDMKEIIPDITKTIIKSEIESFLSTNNTYPILTETDTWRTIVAIDILAKIDPSLLPEKTSEFILYVIKEITNISPDAYIFSSRVNLLLDIALNMQLPNVNDKETIDRIRAYFKNNILPLQNIHGGFGPSETIEPLITSENVILANRLEVPYPRLDILLAEIENHWMGNGWSLFLVNNLDIDNVIVTYFGIDVGKYSGFHYDKNKISVFLRQLLSSNQEMTTNTMLYIVNSLETLNGSLSKEDKNNISNYCKECIDNILSTSNFYNSDKYLFLLPICNKVNYARSDEIQQKLLEIIHQYKVKVDKEGVNCPQQIYNLWISQNTDPIITKQDIKNYLSVVYDEEFGAYTALVRPQQSEFGISYLPLPDIYQTYLALYLLSENGISLPDEKKTINFVVDCKQIYGFSRAPDWYNMTSIQNTFAALMILEQLYRGK
jgi:hypothetical protein